jgi:hypothetical protein
MKPAVQLKLDPWASDFEGAVAIADDGSSEPAQVNVRVETERWEAIEPEDAGAGTAPLVFIDGVRRVDARLLATTDEGHTFGLLGSFAVGAVRAGHGTPEILALTTGRLLILGRGCVHPGVTVALPGGGCSLDYEAAAVPGPEPEAPLLGLLAAMRRAEADLARALAGPAGEARGGPAGAPAGGAGTGAPAGGAGAGALIVADGPLAYLERTHTPLVGFVKSLHRAYLGSAELKLLPRLRPGQRTPIFAILDKNQRYSWYLRLASIGPAEHELAGIARLECGSQCGLAAAQAIAGRTAGTLVRFASTRSRDPRSPQNLIPLGGLEAVLRHRLGDHALARRAITAHLAEQVLATSAGGL